MMLLKEKYGLTPDTGKSTSSLIEWYNSVINKSEDELNEGDIARIIRQTGIFHGEIQEFATNRAIEMISNDPQSGEMYEGELLRSLTGILEETNNISSLQKFINLKENIEKWRDKKWENLSSIEDKYERKEIKHQRDEF
ncbi:MAG: contact-dependent growth inhibition system immunity protein, partial [Streptococcaceae bacterium]|nr:contact-dependent growth inhibition system immunity protein [Streptococcaceae bacterium]